MRIRRLAIAVCLIAGAAVSANAADLRDSLKKGSPDLKSAGVLAFGPEGILFVGDSQTASVYAFDTGDRTATATAVQRIDAIDQKIASLLGTTPQQITINDMAVNPLSNKVYLSVARGKGPDAAPVLLRVESANKIEALSLADIPFAKAPLPSPPSPTAERRGQSLRADTITDLAFVNGRVFVAGLSNEEFASRLLSIPFPFSETAGGTSVEIYHGAHGRFETASPIRTFVPFEVAGETNLLAAYTCTPLVKVPVSQLKPGSHVKGTTVAELGNRNRPLDMIAYKKEGKAFLLLANNNRGVMKISTENLDRAEAITDPVRDGGTKGQAYETLDQLKGVMQLDRLDDSRAVVLVRNDAGVHSLEPIALP